MYAIKGTSYRAIRNASDLQAGETAVDELPAALLQQIEAEEAARDATRGTLQGQALAAMSNLRAYRDLASPTSAQTVAAVNLLCRVAIGLIRLQLARLDAAD